MRRLLEFLWSLPWPEVFRQRGEELARCFPFHWMLFPAFNLGVVAIVTDESGQVLLVRHTYRREYPWGLPGGFLEHGEELEQGVQREVREETGVEAHIEGMWKVYLEHGRPLLNIVFRARAASRTPFVPNAEISEARFFPVNAAPSLMPAQVELLAAWTQEYGRD